MINRPRNYVYWNKRPTNQALLVFFSPFFLDLYGQVDLCSKRGAGDKVKKTREVAKKDSSTPIVTKRASPLFTDDDRG